MYFIKISETMKPCNLNPDPFTKDHLPYTPY